MTVSLIRTILLYAIIIFAIRLMGKRQISELQTSELVVTLLISDIASIPMQNVDLPILSGLIPIAILVTCEIILSSLMLKSSKFRKFICGKPVILINDGKLDQKAMKDLRISTEDLFEQLRQLDVLSINDISYAIVETNGKISIIKKPSKQQVEAGMLGISEPDGGIETVIVSDGEISKSSLSICNLSEEWLLKVISKKQLKLNDIFIMTANKNKEFTIIKKEVVK